jgi:TolB protein
MKSIYPSISLLLSLLMMSCVSHAQNDLPVLDSPYTIAYTSKGVVKIYSSDKEGKSNIKIIDTDGDYLALSPDGKHGLFIQ